MSETAATRDSAGQTVAQVAAGHVYAGQGQSRQRDPVAPGPWWDSDDMMIPPEGWWNEDGADGQTEAQLPDVP